MAGHLDGAEKYCATRTPCGRRCAPPTHCSWQVEPPTAALRVRWTTALATVGPSHTSIDRMDDPTTRYVIDARMWRVHLLVHVGRSRARRRRVARIALANKRSGQPAVHDVGSDRIRFPAVAAKGPASQLLSET